MARKRKRRRRRLKKQLQYELLGLLFIFLAIFGSGASAISDGKIPAGLEHIFRFFFGIWYFFASLALLITGLFLLIKRRYPDFFNKKLIGFYFGFLGLLLLTHIQSYESILLSKENASILKMTWQSFVSYLNGQATVSQLGGGFVGGLLFAFCYYLFSAAGAKIVAVFSMIIGFIFLTEFSLGQFFIQLGQKIAEFYQYVKNKGIEFKEQSAKKRDEKQEDWQGMDPPIAESSEEELPDIAYSFDNGHHMMYPPMNEQDDEQLEEDDTDFIHNIGTVEKENTDYQLPPIDLLVEPAYHSKQYDTSHIQSTVRTLEKTFQSFGVKAKVAKVHVGPAVTKYEILPDAGVKVSRIVSLHDDLALALAASDLRIEAPIPGKSAVGIEVPNKEISTVLLREVLDVMTQDSSKLLFALGRDVSGQAVVGELNKMPHLLIAGATGSGKSVCINGIITTLLMRTKPHEVKMMMIDPKKVELNIYNGIPHLLTPVVTDPKKAAKALQKVVAEMERRYELFSETGTRNIEGYNDYIVKSKTDEEQTKLPYIVVIVDELADLMMVASKDVEDAITRLAQMARAAGIHLIIATQRPSVDVITGVIKANIPSRIAFSVSSQVDSRTILDTGGAEKLLGRGDMLYLPVGRSKPIRVQGAFLSDEEVARVVEHCRGEQEVVYHEEMIPDDNGEQYEDVDDELYEDAVQLVIEMQSASVSMLQRRFRIGYNRAARLIDAMEDRGIVGPHEGSKPRMVLIDNHTEEKSS